MATHRTSPDPGPTLLRFVMAGFILKGTTLTRWCRENGQPTTNARLCLLGAWDGPKGRELRELLIKQSGALAVSAAVSRKHAEVAR